MMFDSKLPFLHYFLSEIPMPFDFPTWKDVLNERPVPSHLVWVIIFTILWTLIRLIVYLIGNPIGIYFLQSSNSQTQKLLEEEEVNNDSNKTTQNSQPTKSGTNTNAQHKLDKLILNLGTSKVDLSLLEKQTGLSREVIKKRIKHFQKFNNTATELNKWNETLFFAIAYTIVLVLGIYLFINEDWLYSRVDIWKGYPDQSIKIDAKFYCLFQLALYVHLFITCMLLDSRLSDFWVMFSHHIITITLVTACYTLDYLRIGIAILLVHDASDPLLNWAKIFRYINMKILCNLTFSLLLVVWLLTRMIIFPLHCIRSVHQESFKYTHSRYGEFFESFLIVLYFLHIYWFYLLLCIAWKAFNGKDVEDPR